MKTNLNSQSRRSDSIHKAAELAGPGLAILTLCMAAFCPHTAHALGVRIPNQDPEAIARGNAFAATADNPSALYYNPAGITQLPGENIQVGVLNYLGIYAHFDSATGGGADNKIHVLPVPEFYYTYSPESLPFSFGLGAYAPFGLGMEWPDSSGFRSLASTANLQYLTINPVAAWRIDKTLSIAAGPTFNYSKLVIRRGLGATPVDQFQFDGNGFSYGLTAGLLWHPFTQWSFGLNYRSASTMTYGGSTTYNPLPGTTPAASTSTTASFQFPQIISGGVSFRPTPKWNVEADVDWSDWHTLRTVPLLGTGSNPYFAGMGNLELALNWHGSWLAELGATRYLRNGWFVSSGYFYSSETTSQQYFNPAIPDTELHVASLGGGHKGKHLDWAAAVQLIGGPKRTISNTQTPSQFPANGSYQLFVPTFSASANYHF